MAYEWIAPTVTLLGSIFGGGSSKPPEDPLLTLMKQRRDKLHKMFSPMFFDAVQKYLSEQKQGFDFRPVQAGLAAGERASQMVGVNSRGGRNRQRLTLSEWENTMNRPEEIAKTLISLGNPNAAHQYGLAKTQMAQQKWLQDLQKQMQMWNLLGQIAGGVKW